MQIFLDTVDLDDLATLVRTGFVDGVTTNPSLIAKSGRDFKATIAEICALAPGPVSAEVAATDAETMLVEARVLAAIAENVVVKLPLTEDGLIACRTLSEDAIQTNVTLCFTANQALLAAKAGATFVSPFIGRLDDIGADGVALIDEIRAIYDIYAYDTEILAASIRSPAHVAAAASAGADAATLPPKIFRQLFRHPLTDKGLDQFVADWASTGQSIV